jgi:hypothetical protein
MRFTNIQPGPRGINAVSGTIVVAPKETVEAEVYEREREHLEASNWFDIKGDYTPNPDGLAAPVLQAVASDASKEIEDLKRQLAERDAEVAKLKEAKSEEPAKTPAEVLAMATNPDVQFMTFKSAATKLLGDKTPSKKDEIVAALEELATKP